ncbi:MAG: hypothetical protein ABI772_08395 [Bacteroidota bacterium]
MKEGKSNKGKIILICIAVVILFLIFYLPSLLEKQLSERLSDGVYTTTNGSYRLEFFDLEVKFFPLQLILSKPSLIPVRNDTVLTSVSISAEIMHLNDLDLKAILFKKHLSIGDITFVKPAVYIYRSVSEKDTGVVVKKEKGRVDSLTIGHIHIIDAAITLFSNESDSIVLSAKHNGIEIKNLKLVAEKVNKSAGFSAGAFTADLHDLEWKLEKGFYALKTKNIYFDYNSSYVQVDSLMLQPLYSEKKFAAKSVYQTDRFECFIRKVSILNCDINRALKYKVVNADSLIIDGGNITAYRNKNYQRKIEVIPSLQERIAECPVVINLNGCSVHNIDVAYKELAEGQNVAGIIRIKSIDADVSKVSTGHVSSDTLKILSTARLMSGGSMHVVWKFPMQHKKVRFLTSGTIENFKVTDINSMSLPNIHVEFIDGFINKLQFNMSADHNSAKGEVYMNYRDLKVSIKDKNGNNSLGGVTSLAVNKLFIHENNPEKNHELRKGTIAYPNNPQRFMFNYAFKALSTGISDAVLMRK